MAPETRRLLTRIKVHGSCVLWQHDVASSHHNIRNSDGGQAMALDKRQAIAQYGMAQLSLLQGPREVVNAISLLESALETAPAWPDALKVCCGYRTLLNSASRPSASLYLDAP